MPLRRSHALLLTLSLAFVPAATAGLAAVDDKAAARFAEFLDVYSRIKADYVEPVDDQKLIRGAIQGMLESLDPHSSFLDEASFTQLRTQTEGNYAGLGLSVTMEDGVVKVISPTADTPAARAGIKPGDYITHVDGKLIYGGTLDEAVDAMRGPPGSSVRITIVRPGRDLPIDLTLKREIINIQPVKWEVKDRVGVITIATFSDQTGADVSQAVESIQKSLGGKPLGYILDLRGNPGGLLDEAVAVSDDFLNDGVIVTQRGRRKQDSGEFDAHPGDIAAGTPIIVLINAGSASASEIVAGALQDHKRALIMGERSFGKGSVQTLLPLSATTALRLTTARYYTPSGRSVQEGGIQPDIRVPQLSDPDYKARPSFREADLRRHLINEVAVKEDVLEEDQKPDPRFSATPAELKKQGIDDFQLHYALQTLDRLAPPMAARAAAPAPRPARARR